MIPDKRKKALPVLLLGILAFLSALLYNELNLSHLRKNNFSLREGATVITSDDLSYLNPALNYYNGLEWKENWVGKGSYFLRPPGYGLLIYVCLLLGGITKYLLVLKFMQLFLFSVSVACLYKICLWLSESNKLAIFTAATYGLTPFASGFLYYTLTEGITPALIIFFFYFLCKAYYNSILKQKIKNYVFTGLIFSGLFLTRPVLGFFGLLVLILFFRNFYGLFKNIKLTVYLVLLSIIMLAPGAIWAIRNYKLSGEWTGLHPIYFSENNSIYRESYRSLWKYVSGWEADPQYFHQLVLPVWQVAILGDTSTAMVQNALDKIPDRIKLISGADQLYRGLKLYQEAVVYQSEFHKKNLPMPVRITPAEQKVMDHFENLRNDFIKNNFWEYYFVTPFKVLKKMIFHSNLSLYIFQVEWRGRVLTELLRIVFTLLHIGLFLTVFISVIIPNISLLIRITSLICISYIFYLVWIQRGLEERYTLPILPLLLIIVNEVISGLRKKIKPKSV